MSEEITISTCKKCGAALKDDFCSKCGNPKTLKRINGSYLINEVASVLNFDKGVLYTIKELFLRPGDTVREFLLNDRNRIVKPIIFVIFSSILFIVSQQIVGFNTGSIPPGTKGGALLVLEWVGRNFGIVNIVLGAFIGFWTWLFFINSSFNIYEIFILVLFTIGITNLIYIFFGIVESVTGFENFYFIFFMTIVYSSWAIGNFFNKRKILSYVKGFFAFFLGISTGQILIGLIAVLIDVFNKTN